MINKFEDYERLNEASLMGNPGLPGEPSPDGRKGSYLASVDDRLDQKLTDLQRTYGIDMIRLMDFVNEARQIQRGHESDLEKLAKETIMDEYSEILEAINLIIKFDTGGKIPKMMSDVPSKPCCDDQLKELEDSNIISEIHRRKIAKNILQGEAVNTKKILNSDVSRAGLVKILGRENGEKYRVLLNKITDIAQHFYWVIPHDIHLTMWERDKSGMSGSCKVEWTTPADQKDAEEQAQEITDQLIQSPELPEDDIIELFDEIDATIHALGTDYAMLIHETVKGIYQLIMSVAIPDDEEVAQAVIDNTDTLEDEIEDLKYGPEIAADLRDYIGEFPEADKISNLRARVYGKMMQMEANEMLELILQILEVNPAAKPKIQGIIDEISQELKDYQNGEYNDDESEENSAAASASAHYPDEADYKNMSQKDLQKLVDQALDSGDMEKFKELSSHLTESMKVKAFAKYPALDECRLM
jgi:aryl carrier-like protein